VLVPHTRNNPGAQASVAVAGLALRVPVQAPASAVAVGVLGLAVHPTVAVECGAGVATGAPG